MKVAVLLLCLAACACGIRIIGGKQYGLIGGKYKVPLDKIENFDEIRHLLVSAFNQKFDLPNFYTIYHVEVEADRQLISGVKYGFEFSVIATECKNKPSNYHRLLGIGQGKCRATKKYQPQKCYATVIEKAWRNYLNVTEIRCSPVVTMLLHRVARSVSSKAEHAFIGSYQDFAAFKARHGRVYSSPEEEYRRYEVFRVNMQKARVLNAIELGSGVYGHSPFADMTEEEFRRTRLTPQWDLARMPKKQAAPVPTAPPAAFDWRDHGAVTAVKNQGSCGSCWAFSTTGNVEGQWAIKKKKLVSLSEQELVDCDKVDQGCQGGLPTDAYKAIEKLGGLELESAYPYEAENEQCKFKKSLVRAYINGSVSLPKDEAKLAAWLAVNGPISIGINANAMQFYFGGISHPWSIFCNPNKLDHGVLLVGYGMKGSEPFWIVKNSWGPSWGEKGYYLVYRGSGVCGLNRMATSSTVN